MAELQAALREAFNGNEVEDVDVSGHGFIIKPIRRVKEGTVAKVFGRLSHQRRFAADDQIKYVITLNEVEPGKIVVQDNAIDIETGGFLANLLPDWAIAAAAVLAPGLGLPLGSAVYGERIGQIVIRDWPDALAVILANIAIRYAEAPIVDRIEW